MEKSADPWTGVLGYLALNLFYHSRLTTCSGFKGTSEEVPKRFGRFEGNSGFEEGILGGRADLKKGFEDLKAIADSKKGFWGEKLI